MRKSIRIGIAVSMFLAIFFNTPITTAQDLKAEFEAFRNQAFNRYNSFRDECNQRYTDFLREAWQRYENQEPIPKPIEKVPVPPIIYEEKETIPVPPVIKNPVIDTPEPPIVQPEPPAPIKEVPAPNVDYFTTTFYGIKPQVRMPELSSIRVKGISPNNVADWWQQASSSKKLENTLYDCLEVRKKYNLNDWAYLMFINNLVNAYCTNPNEATLLKAWLFCQSGYQMRLAVDGNHLVMLYGSKHRIYSKKFFILDGMNFYPISDVSPSIIISQAKFEGETPMSMMIDSEPLLGEKMHDTRIITSKRYKDMEIPAEVPQSIIDFFDSYPASEVGGNVMTRWAMYANTPLSETTRQTLYPALQAAIDGKTVQQAANMLLNWIQTGLVYEYDEKVWGYDRAFFAEETLYYPYCDCEDRSILFSRLVRDLLGLDVALVYYPGHLATAVDFKEEVKGAQIEIDGRLFTICDPTYIGAPIGLQMPNMDASKARAIVLNR